MVLYDNTTLVVRNLPNEISKEDKVSLLKYFGAEEVKCIPSKKDVANRLFAKFRSAYDADIALKKLHQKELLGQLICAEFARGNDSMKKFPIDIDRRDDIKEEQTIQRKYLESFTLKLNSWTNHLDFTQPPPVHFKYQYPPPTVQVLTNIAKVLSTVPKFYTQVLHLMNKMNLPCPFSETFNVESDIISDNLIKNTQEKDVSEEESEIESDEDVKRGEEIVPLKRKKPSVKKIIKKPRLIIKPPESVVKSKTSIRAEDVFETGQVEPPKKIEVKVSGDLNRLALEKEVISEEGFEKVQPIVNKHKDSEEKSQTEEDTAKCISAEELASNRISSKDQHILPVFKNYQQGIPSCRLYIKNLAKNVSKDDLNYIFKRYLLPVVEEQGSMYDVQLLQEGRMKGQAFISLQNVDQAKQALNETNGYILKGKPMVVQFARSLKPK